MKISYFDPNGGRVIVDLDTDAIELVDSKGRTLLVGEPEKNKGFLVSARNSISMSTTEGIQVMEYFTQAYRDLAAKQIKKAEGLVGKTIADFQIEYGRVGLMQFTDGTFALFHVDMAGWDGDDPTLVLENTLYELLDSNGLREIFLEPHETFKERCAMQDWLEQQEELRERAEFARLKEKFEKAS